MDKIYETSSSLTLVSCEIARCGKILISIFQQFSVSFRDFGFGGRAGRSGDLRFYEDLRFF